MGDIHGNAPALRAALAEARRRGFDRLVLLGDLLTYGPDVDEVLDLVHAEVAAGARLLFGNHEEIYLDPDSAYARNLSPFLTTCADHVRSQLDVERLGALPFERHTRLGGVWFSHANPWNDWRYLHTTRDHEDAAKVLAHNEVRVGVFGHTHRGRLVAMPGGDGVRDDDPAPLGWTAEQPGDCLVLNAGSVGQPRNRAARSTFLVLEGSGDSWHAELVPIVYDVVAHVDALHALPLPEAIRARLIAFHVPG